MRKSIIQDFVMASASKSRSSVPQRRRHTAAGIREAIRQEIIAGNFAPGAQLPTHINLAARFGVSNVTIQHALKQLAADKFIEIRPRIGLFCR